MASSNTRAASLSAYRQLVSLIKASPEGQRLNAMKQLRDGFVRNRDAPESDVPGLLKEAETKAAFLRVTTPRSAHRNRGSQAGTTTWVYRRGGEVQEGGKSSIVEKARVSNWSGNNLDPCSLKRHQTGLKRAGFMNNAHAKGIF